MAIDSAEKRKAAAGAYRVAVKGVTPNSSEDAEWRQQATHKYSGVAADAPAESTFANGGLSFGLHIGLR